MKHSRALCKSSLWFTAILGLMAFVDAAFSQPVPPPAAEQKAGFVRADDGKQYALGRVAPTKEQAQRAHAMSMPHAHKIRMLALRAVPADFDCAAFGLVPPIKDQGNCGSCYWFSAFGPITSSLVKAGQIKLSDDGLSEQWGLDCRREQGGCGGGWEWTVAELIMNVGAPLEGFYGPYRAQPGQCKPVPKDKLYRHSDMAMCSPGVDGVARTIDIQNMMIENGPISVAVAADNTFSSYRSGLFNGSGSRQVNHAVVLTGWKTASGSVYWKMRNSWGTGWGDQGYMWIKERANEIGVEAFWVRAESVNPPDPPGPIPPGPIPPGPLPPSGATISFGQDMKAGTYELHKAGTGRMLRDIREWLNRVESPEPPVNFPETAPPTTKTPVKKLSDADVDRIMKEAGSFMKHGTGTDREKAEMLITIFPDVLNKLSPKAPPKVDPWKEEVEAHKKRTDEALNRIIDLLEGKKKGS